MNTTLFADEKEKPEYFPKDEDGSYKEIETECDILRKGDLISLGINHENGDVSYPNFVVTHSTLVVCDDSVFQLTYLSGSPTLSDADCLDAIAGGEE